MVVVLGMDVGMGMGIGIRMSIGIIGMCIVMGMCMGMGILLCICCVSGVYLGCLWGVHGVCIISAEYYLC